MLVAESQRPWYLTLSTKNAERMGHGVSLARMSCRGILRLKLMRWLPNRTDSGRVLPGPRAGFCAAGVEAWVGLREVFAHGVTATPARSGRLGQGLFAEPGPRSQPGPKQDRLRCRGHSQCGWGNRGLQNAAFRWKLRIPRRETAPGFGYPHEHNNKGFEEGTA